MSDTHSNPSFAGLPRRDREDLASASVGLIGLAEASPYKSGEPSHSAKAPAAIRAASQLFVGQLHQYDFDLDAILLDSEGGSRGIVDLGDVETDCRQSARNRDRITGAVRALLEAGVAPVVVGGDDSVPIPVFQAFNGRGPITILQIDAHVDWGDVIQDNPYGYGSTMRRASEMPWVAGMVQVGIRGLGSGTPDQMEDARAWGSRIVTMSDLRRTGVQAVVDLIPPGADVIVTIDCDGLDPAVLPAVNMPTPGGLSYGDVQDLLRGAAQRGRIVGGTVVELVPGRDEPHGLSALVASRLVLTLLGLIRAGR